MSRDKESGRERNFEPAGVTAGSSRRTRSPKHFCDYFFEKQNSKKKGRLNADTDSFSVPQTLCAEALPKFLAELESPRKKYRPSAL